MRKNYKGWDEIRKKLENSQITPPYPTWQELHQAVQNRDSWNYVGRKVASYEQTPPNYIKQRIFYGSPIVRYSPMPVLLIGFLIGLLAGLLVTYKHDVYNWITYNTDHIIANEYRKTQHVENLQANNTLSNNALQDSEESLSKYAKTPNTYIQSNSPTVLADASQTSLNSMRNNLGSGLNNPVNTYASHPDDSSALRSIPPLKPTLQLSKQQNSDIKAMTPEFGSNKQAFSSSIPIIAEIHGGANLTRIASLNSEGFSNKVFPGFQTSLLIATPVYKGHLVYLALSKTHSRVSVFIEGREYYNHISGTALEIGGISKTGFVLNGRHFYVRYGLLWSQFHSNNSASIIKAGRSLGGLIAIRRFSGMLGRRFVWGWEGGMSMLFKDVSNLQGGQIPVNFYISAIIGFKM